MPLGLSCYHAPSCTYILSPCVLPDCSYWTMTSFIGLTHYLDTQQLHCVYSPFLLGLHSHAPTASSTDSPSYYILHTCVISAPIRLISFAAYCTYNCASVSILLRCRADSFRLHIPILYDDLYFNCFTQLYTLQYIGSLVKAIVTSDLVSFVIPGP